MPQGLIDRVTRTPNYFAVQYDDGVTAYVKRGGVVDYAFHTRAGATREECLARAEVFQVAHGGELRWTSGDMPVVRIAK